MGLIRSIRSLRSLTAGGSTAMAKAPAVLVAAGTLGVSGLLGGCASANGMHEFLPPANYVSAPVPPPSHVDLFRAGERPQRPFVTFARVAANGSEDSAGDSSTIDSGTQQLLESTIVKEAQKIDADCVILTGRRVSVDGETGMLSGGTFIATAVKRPHLYGLACRYVNVTSGLLIRRDGAIQYVAPDSAAQRAGLIEGDRVVAVNGIAFQTSPFVMAEQVSAKHPGDHVPFTVISRDGVKRIAVLTLQAYR